LTSNSKLYKSEIKKLIQKENPICPYDGKPCHRKYRNCVDIFMDKNTFESEEFYCSRFMGYIDGMNVKLVKD